MMGKYNNFRKALESLLNEHSMENDSNTPDFILAKYLTTQLEFFDNMMRERDEWYRKEKS